jgi:serine phosphatase RsbU (regulator of sigma subunit)/Tfp pilus assembly protein PilF
MLYRAFFFQFFFFIAGFSFAQDTSAIMNILGTAKQLISTDPDSADVLIRSALGESEKINFKAGAARAYQYLGSICRFKGNLAGAKENYFKALPLYESENNLDGLSGLYSNIGNLEFDYGNLEIAMEYHLKSLKISEARNNLRHQSNSLNNIGNILCQQKNYKQGEEYYRKAIAIRVQLNDSLGLASGYNNLGHLHHSLNAKDSTLFYFQKALLIRERINDRVGLVSSYNNLASIYNEIGNYKEALKFAEKGLLMAKQLNDVNGIAYSYGNSGYVYLRTKNFPRAVEYFEKALAIGLETGAAELIIESYASLGISYKEMGDYRKAYEYISDYSRMKDSLMGKETMESLNKMRALFDLEKKEKELFKKDAELAKKETEAAERKYQRNLLLGGVLALVIVLVFSVFIIQRKKKDNRIISWQKKEVERQNNLLEEKNKEITDSINYAKRIQEALLPRIDLIRKDFPDSFVVFKPRNIVSGDFIWYSDSGGYKFIVVADCTGHGVPGGFMSMLGISFLNQIVKENACYEPAEILSRLREKVLESLSQSGSGSETRDGMDLSLLRVNEKTREVVFSGAMNGFYWVNSFGLNEIPGDKMPIGSYEGPHTSFRQETRTLNKGDMMYLVSDGFADQFGGPKGKKFKYRQLESLLPEIATAPAEDQKAKLERIFKDWMGSMDQVDDVTVLGIRIL